MFYAYRPNSDGSEPVGREGKLIRTDITDGKYFVRLACRILGSSAKAFYCSDFDDNKTFVSLN